MSIYIYEDKRGEHPFLSWYHQLQRKNEAMFHKVNALLKEMDDDSLERVRPRVKKMLARTDYRHLYKMRLGKYRLFFLYENQHYYLLHAFRKTSQTTPEKEVKKVSKEIEEHRFVPLTISLLQEKQ